MIDRGELLRKLILNVVRFSGAGAIAGRFTAGAGAILMLHRVTSDPVPPFGFNRHLTISPRFLDAVLAETAGLGFQFVSMDEAVDRLNSRSRSERFVAITADDGYRDNITCALPILEKYAAPITIYAAPNLVERKVDLWWDVVEDIVTKRDHIYLDTPRGRLSIESATPGDKFRANTLIQNYLTAELPEEAQRKTIRELAASAGVDASRPGRETLMTWDELRSAASHPLVTIGAHTMNHYNLAKLDAGQALREMTDSSRVLEMELGVRPAHFAYPYGYVSAVGRREVDLAKEAGFETAVTTRHGVLRWEHSNHLHALPRISVNGRYQQVSHVRTMMSGITTAMANRGKALVTV
jgi:peptidoglycan/xylan/chitin deacetylase (PgdA/CDA1 family)